MSVFTPRMTEEQFLEVKALIKQDREWKALWLFIRYVWSSPVGIWDVVFAALLGAVVGLYVGVWL